MEFGDRLGIAGLIIGIAGVGVTILWPTKRFIGVVCIIFAAALLVGWGGLEIHDRLHGKGNAQNQAERPSEEARPTPPTATSEPIVVQSTTTKKHKKQSQPQQPNSNNSLNVSAPNGIAIGGNNNGIATVNNNPAVNPNAMTVMYDCGGNRRSSGPTPNTGLSVTLDVGHDESALKEMVRLNDAQQYSELLDTCRGNIAGEPEWLTPYLFCGLGYFASGDKLKAREMLAHYEQYKGPAYNVEMCNNIEDFLRNNLQGF